jgi:hypothetical protein
VASLKYSVIEGSVTNTPAYYDTLTITAIKSFIVNSPMDCTIKLLTAVIDEPNMLECFSVADLSSLVYYLWERLEPTQVVLRYCRLSDKHTIAYCDTAIITAQKVL